MLSEMAVVHRLLNPKASCCCCFLFPYIQFLCPFDDGKYSSGFLPISCVSPQNNCLGALARWLPSGMTCLKGLWCYCFGRNQTSIKNLWRCCYVVATIIRQLLYLCPVSYQISPRKDVLWVKNSNSNCYSNFTVPLGKFGLATLHNKSAQ